MNTAPVRMIGARALGALLPAGLLPPVDWEHARVRFQVVQLGPPRGHSFAVHLIAGGRSWNLSALGVAPYFRSEREGESAAPEAMAWCLWFAELYRIKTTDVLWHEGASP